MLSQTLDAQQFAAHLSSAAAAISYSLLTSAAPVTRAAVNGAMSEAFQATSREGVWTQRDSFQMCEIALVMALSSTELPLDAIAAVAQLEALEARLPTQTVRSEDQVALQHFSTPAGLTWMVGRLAAITPDDTSLQLNELDPVRKAVLGRLFAQSVVTDHDAAKIGSIITHRPTVILMNPPFSKNAAGYADASVAARHFAAGLSVLAPGGRLVAVMPDSFSATGPHSESYKRAIAGAVVRLDCRLSGAFKKQGTSVLVRVLVADKGLSGGHAPAITLGSASELLSQVPELPERLQLADVREGNPTSPNAGKAALFAGLPPPDLPHCVLAQREG